MPTWAIKYFLLSMISLCCLSIDAYAVDEPVTVKNWKITEFGDDIIYKVNGEDIWGHEFGFYLITDHCEYSYLWITLSTFQPGLKQFQGRDVQFKLFTENKVYSLSSELTTAFDYSGDMKVLAFASYPVGSEFKDFLKSEGHLVVALVEPVELKALMDYPGELFLLEGMAEARELAITMCRAKSKRVVFRPRMLANMGERLR